MNLRVDVYFLQPSYLRPRPEPMVLVALITKGWPGLNFGEHLAGVLEHLGVQPEPEQRDKLVENFMAEAGEALTRLQNSLASEIPVSDSDLERAWALTLPLAPTSALVTSGMDASVIADRYEHWLRAVIASWFQAGPERALERLVIDVMLP